MTSNRPLPAILNAIFLFVAAAGIVVQIIAGVPGYPVVPPGPIILAVAGILVLALVTRVWWIIVVGIVAPAFIVIGGLIEGSMWDRLGNPGDYGPFIGTALQMSGVVVALICGVVAYRAVRGVAPVGTVGSSR